LIDIPLLVEILENSQQTVAGVVPITVVTNPFPFPQIEFGTGSLSAALLAPGIMTQS
jgi:hypothetical protein